MPTKHIVLAKFKPEATKDQVDAFFTNVLTLKDKVNGILDCKILPPNNSTESFQNWVGNSFSQGFEMTFVDSKARDDYLPHEEHQKVVATYVLPIIADICIYDYDY